MDITLFLAKIWGPIILAVGIGVFVSRNYYIKVYRELEKETLAVLLFGMIGMATAITQISFHNSWNTLPQILISYLGWALLAKSILLTTAPKYVDRLGDWAASSKIIPVTGLIMLIAGAYLSWIGYMM